MRAPGTGLRPSRSLCMFLQHPISGHANAPLKRHVGTKSTELPARRYETAFSKLEDAGCFLPRGETRSG
jgi:hypothetical protein